MTFTADFENQTENRNKREDDQAKSILLWNTIIKLMYKQWRKWGKNGWNMKKCVKVFARLILSPSITIFVRNNEPYFWV